MPFAWVNRWTSISLKDPPWVLQKKHQSTKKFQHAPQPPGPPVSIFLPIASQWPEQEWLFFPPHLCVGFLFLILYPAAASASSASSASSTLSTTNFVTHNFVNHHLCHTQLCQPPSFTHNFHHLCHTHHLCRVVVSPGRRGTRGTYGTGLALVARLDWISRRWRRGTLRGRRGTWSHPPSFHVAGVALGDIHLRFAWQAWHLWHWAGSGGALGLD